MNTKLGLAGQARGEQCREDFVGVMQAMGDFCPKMVVHLAPPTRGRDMLWWNQPMDMAPGAGIWIGATQETWSVLGQRILAGAGNEGHSRRRAGARGGSCFRLRDCDQCR